MLKFKIFFSPVGDLGCPLGPVARHNIFWAGGMVTHGGLGIIVSCLKIQEI